jgi:hypothetical protein
MKPHISRDGGKGIPNGVVGCNPFPTIGKMKKKGPHGIKKLVTNVMSQLKS